MKYICIVENENGIARQYATDSRNVLKLADAYGRTDDTVTITTKGGREVCRAKWDVSARKYMRVAL